ncbi:hypothetical protein LBMAG53_30540 [Planctomycetota bacterium]|nr:hypothetical protein LBMAG53_30540 [Planctomycetota bacterium]
MSQVLDRSVRLLTALAARAEGATTGTLAAASGLPPATAARLLAALRQVGFADQDGRRGRWRPGPLVSALAARAPYRHALTGLVRARAQQLASHHRCGVVLSCLRGSRRITLLHLPRPGRQGGAPFAESDDLWDSAGGRLLVAHLPRQARIRLIAVIGLPGPLWPGLLTRAELDGELRTIARAGQAERQAHGTRSLACAVPDGQGGLASLGAYLADGSAWTAMAQDLLALAAAITADLDGSITDGRRGKSG